MLRRRRFRDLRESLSFKLARSQVRERAPHYVAAYSRLYPTKYAKFGNIRFSRSSSATVRPVPITKRPSGLSLPSIRAQPEPSWCLGTGPHGDADCSFVLGEPPLSHNPSGGFFTRCSQRKGGAPVLARAANMLRFHKACTKRWRRFQPVPRQWPLASGVHPCPLFRPRA